MGSIVSIQDIGIYSREDKYLYAIATGDLSVLPQEDITRAEKYYKQIALNGVGGGNTLSTIETEEPFTTILQTNGGYINDILIEGKTVDGVSVGEDVDALYIETNSENLFDESELNNYIIESDADSFTLNYYKLYMDEYMFKIVDGGRYTFRYVCKETVGGKNPRFAFAYSDGSVDYINAQTTAEYVEYIKTSSPYKTVVGLKVVFGSNGGNWHIKKNSIILNKGTSLKGYAPNQSVKRPILYYNPNSQTWDKPILGEGTYIEKHLDGKYYYHTHDGIYECNNLSLMSYEGETNLSLYTGELSPKVRIRLQQNLPNVVNILQGKLNLLEEVITRSLIGDKQTAIELLCLDNNTEQDIMIVPE